MNRRRLLLSHKPHCYGLIGAIIVLVGCSPDEKSSLDGVHPAPAEVSAVHGLDEARVQSIHEVLIAIDPHVDTLHVLV